MMFDSSAVPLRLTASPRVNRPQYITCQAFTLIELLVVISVIALLIGILLPVLASARDTARTLLCLSNMRTLMQATAQYVNDHDLLYPYGDTGADTSAPGALAGVDSDASCWFNALDYYVQQDTEASAAGATVDDRNHVPFKHDPVWLSFPETPAGSQTIREWNRTIKMNKAFAPDLADRGTRFNDQFISADEIEVTSNTVAYGDGLAQDVRPVTGTLDDPPGGPVSRFTIEAPRPGDDDPADGILRLALRHPNDAANIAFTDGSASTIRQDIVEVGHENGSGNAGSDFFIKSWHAEFIGSGGTASFFGGGAPGGGAPSLEDNPRQDLIFNFDLITN